jgi:FtsH-binding integral membrane protein
MATRMIGVAGYFFFYAFFSSRKPRPYWLRRTAEILLAIYACMTTYAVLQVSEDREGFLKLVPGSQTVLFLYATLLGCVGLCLLPGLFTYDITVMLTVLLTLSTILVDCQISYWTKRRGLHYWNQIRLLADNIAILMGCIMYLTCTRKKLPEDDRPKSD